MGVDNPSIVQKTSCIVYSIIMIVLIKSVASENQNVENTLRTLKGQMNALLQNRQEDFHNLEKAIRRYWSENSELVLVKTELKELREEIQRLKGNKEPTLNKQKNDRLTLKWLSLAISELRTELSEILASNNISSEIQQRQELVSGLNLLRGDVVSFRRDLEKLKAQQKQTMVNFEQLKQDVETNINRKHMASVETTEIKSQMDQMKKKMEFFTKSLLKLTKNIEFLKISLIHEMKNQSTVDYLSHSLLSHKLIKNKIYRHNRLFSSQKIKTAGDIYQNHQNQLSKSLEESDKNFGNYDEAPEKLDEKIKKLEVTDKNILKEMFNISKKMEELEHLHLSILQLLETVENLETKVDKYIPDFQREISKVEFNLDQTTASFALIKNDYEHQKSYIRSLAKSLERLEQRLENNYHQLSVLQKQSFNFTGIPNWQMNNSVDVQKADIEEREPLIEEEKVEPILTAKNQSSIPASTLATTEVCENDCLKNANSLSQLIKSLNVIQKQYDTIIRQLPADCGFIKEEKNGIYVIAPGNGAPLLASCDMASSPGGWTVVQRRIDGSQEFNRKWNDYAAGFGTPSGEFWLGNEALHRLTIKKCSSLRIDLTDIYNKKWVAEYENFYISDASDGYRIHVSGYKGNASDALEYQNKMQFSTVDSDRDISNTHCAQNYEGGWWFSHCQHANLNGRYNLGLTWFDSKRNEWIAVAFSEMKIRTKTKCEQ